MPNEEQEYLFKKNNIAVNIIPDYYYKDLEGYPKCKVYNDCSHYIATPHTTRLCKRRPKPPEETIVVKGSTEDEIAVKDGIESLDKDLETKEPDIENEYNKAERKVREISYKDYFDEL